MMPDKMINMDDMPIQSIKEVTQLMYPDDNSIMKVDHFELGGKSFSKSQIIKDNLTFGLRQSTPDQPLTFEEQKAIRDDPSQEFGLFEYNRLGTTEVWTTFENNTKMLGEWIGMRKKETRLRRVDPPKPTPEEIAAREEAAK
mmetsp:Transcript_5576/g.4248  ORF Transcript_5576/g.4248 Transcript_5576/m.4248 type:complete len:142 (+) Transcript_5576:1369-1794(+)